jgi:hypothetical protein
MQVIYGSGSLFSWRLLHKLRMWNYRGITGSELVLYQ